MAHRLPSSDADAGASPHPEQELLNRIYDHEKTHDLFQFEVADLRPWPLIRGHLPGLARASRSSDPLTRRSDGAPSERRRPAQRARQDVWSLKRLLTWAVKRHSDLRGAPGGVLVLTAALRRFRMVGGVMRDPISWPLVHQLSPRAWSSLTPSRDSDPREIRRMQDPEFWFPALASRASRMRWLPSLSRRHRRELESFSSDLARASEIPAESITAYVLSEVRRLMIERRFYRALLRRRRPAWIGLVSAGPHRALKVAAADLHIPVVEVQHGIITPGHLSYHFPGAPVVPYAPRLLLTWGTAWEKAVTLPANCRPLVIGSAYLSGVATVARSADRDPTLGVISLQGIESISMLNRARELARLTPDRRWVCCPHPQEDRKPLERWCAGQAPHNLRLGIAGEDTLSLVARADVHISASSTVLFEGLALGARTIVWSDMPFAESYVRPMLDGYPVAFTTSARETGEVLTTLARPAWPDALFGSPEPDIPAKVEAALYGNPLDLPR